MIANKILSSFILINYKEVIVNTSLNIIIMYHNNFSNCLYTVLYFLLSLLILAL